MSTVITLPAVTAHTDTTLNITISNPMNQILKHGTTQERLAFYNRQRIKARAHNRAILKRNSVLGGLAAKARLIVDGKGRNGKSMTPALLERHMANR